MMISPPTATCIPSYILSSTPPIDEEPCNLTKTFEHLQSQIHNCHTALGTAAKLLAFQRFTVSFFQMIAPIDPLSPLDRKKISLITPLFFQELLEQKRLIKNLKRDEISTDIQGIREIVLSYFSTMKRLLLPLPLFSTFKQRIHIIAQGKGLEEQTDTPAHERAKKAFQEQFATLLACHPLVVTKETFQNILSQKNLWESLRDFFRAEIIKQELFAEPIERALHHDTIQWLSGSLSSSLPIIFQKVLFDGKPSLIPTGVLLKHAIAPLCGELKMGIYFQKGINQEYLSGTDLAHFPTAFHYAQQGTQFSIERKKDELWRYLSCRSGRPEEPDLVQLFILVLQLLEIGALNSEEKQSIAATVSAWDAPERSSINRIIESLSTVHPLSLTPFERSCIEHPFPIIWGSCQRENSVLQDVTPLRLHLQTEAALKGPLPLGEKIQFLFVPDAQIEAVMGYISPLQGLTVSSLKTIQYLFMKHCSFNGYCVYTT